MKIPHLHKYLAIAAFPLILAACGGGGGSSSSTSSTPSSTSGTTTTYTSSGSVGEVLNFTVNTTVSPPTYNYTIIKSSYGLTNSTGSGTLSTNRDGSYTPSGATNSRVYALSNGLLIGGLKLNIGGTQTAVPLIGVSSPVTTLATLAGTYNYISTACTSNANGYPTYPNCGTSYGTIKFTSIGTYVQCTATNIATSPSCSTTTGTVSNVRDGLWEYIRTGSSNKNYLLASIAPNGQTVLLIDYNDAGGYGYGHAVASTQPTSNFVSGNADGTWIANSNGNSSGSVVISGTSFNSTYTTGSNSGTLTLNNPWVGFIKATGTTDAGYALLAGTGVYAYRSNTASDPYYEIGMLKQ
jgi:hypothetical protein